MKVREALRGWVREKSGRDLEDATPIIRDGLITSMHVLDLVLYIERLGGRVQADRLRPGSFESVDAIVENFFEER